MAWNELGVENIPFSTAGDNTQACNPPSGANAFVIGGNYYSNGNDPVNLIEPGFGTLTSLQCISNGPDAMSSYLAWGKVTSAGAASTIRIRFPQATFPEGPTGQIIWLTVEDPDDFARDWDIAPPAPGPLNATVDSTAADAVYAFCGKDGGTGALGPVSGSWTQRGTPQTNNSDNSTVWRSGAPGASTTSATTASADPDGLYYPTLSMISIKNSSAGSPPTVTTQPTDVTVSEGAAADFSAVLSGATSYQWKLNKKLLQNIIDIVDVRPGTSQNPGAQAVAVPADATAVLIFGVFGSTGGLASVTSLTTNFTTADPTITQNAGTGFSASGLIGVAAVNNTAAGRTFTPAFNRAVELGSNFTFVFLKNINPAAITAGVDAECATSASGVVNATVPSDAAKMVLGYDARAGTPPSNPSGWTSLLADSFNVVAQVGYRLRQMDVPGDPDSTMATQESANSLALMVSINEQGFQNADVGTGATTANFSINPTTLAMNGWEAMLTGSNAYGSVDTNVVDLTVNAASVAPVVSNPQGAATGPTTANLKFTTNQGTGTMYSVVTQSATQPSTTQIEAGQTNMGTEAPWSGNLGISSAGEKEFDPTGLTASQTYYGHAFHKNGANQDSNIVTTTAFTTPASGTAPTLSISSQVISGQTLTLSGTYANNPASASISVAVGSPANGAVAIPATPVTFSAGTWSVSIPNVTPGSYAAPVVSMTNAFGTGTANGSAFEVLGIGGEPDAPIDTIRSDSMAFSEAQGRSLAAASARTDALAATEVRTHFLGRSGASTDAIAAMDASTRTAAKLSSRDEDAFVSDAQQGLVSGGATRSDGMGATDLASASVSAAANSSDGLSAADLQSGVSSGLSGTSSDAMDAADAGASNASMEMGQTDLLGATEARAADASMQRAQAESLQAADLPVHTMSFVVSWSDMAWSLDQRQGTVITGQLVLDSMGLTDSRTAEVSSLAKSVAEAMEVQDAGAATIIREAEGSDLLAATDESIALILTGTTVIETFSIEDATALLRYPIPTRPVPYAVRRFRISYR